MKDVYGRKHDWCLWSVGGRAGGRRAGAAVVSPGHDSRPASSTPGGPRRESGFMPVCYNPTSAGSQSPASASACPRWPARGALELATPLRAADGSHLSQAERRDRAAAGGHWAARSWRQQVFRLAEDRPDWRPAPPADEGAPRPLLRRRELGQRAGPAGLCRPGP